MGEAVIVPRPGWVTCFWGFEGGISRYRIRGIIGRVLEPLKRETSALLGYRMENVCFYSDGDFCMFSLAWIVFLK